MLHTIHFAEKPTSQMTQITTTTIPMTNEDPRVTKTLRNLGMEEYLSKFIEARIDYTTFLTLTDYDLRELQIPLGIRKRIEEEIKRLKKMEVTEGN